MGRAVGILVHVLPGGAAGEHQHGVQAGLQARDHVGVHAVAHHHRVLGVHAQHLQARAHHQRIGLAHEVGLLAGGQLHGGNQRAAGGGDALLHGAGEVGVGGDEPRAVHHQPHGLGDDLVVVAGGLAHDHVVGIHVVHGDAAVVERVEQARRADDKGGAAGGLAAEEVGGGQGAGVEVLLAHVQAHAHQLLAQLLGGALAGVGEEEKLLVLLIEPGDELLHAGQQLVAAVDHAVHVADEALLAPQNVEIRHTIFLRFPECEPNFCTQDQPIIKKTKPVGMDGSGFQGNQFLPLVARRVTS